MRHEDTHTTDVSHTALYTANINDNDREITCIATQIDRDGRNVLYESSASIKLKVKRLPPPVDRTMTEHIGIISGVLLGVILLILLLVFCILVICKRRRRKRSRPSSSQATHSSSSPDQQIKPIWTTAPSNGTASNVRKFDHILEPADFPSATSKGGRRRQQPQHQRQHELQTQVDAGDGIARAPSTSTRSTTSRNSWEEEDRSVGGEGEEVTIEQRANPSLHETTFDGDFPPRTVLHPDPYASARGPFQATQHPIYALQQSSTLGRRPSSSADTAYYPYYPQQQQQQLLDPSGRPTSAMSYPASDSPYYNPMTRRMPTPDGQLTTSVKSVFDCDQGCFVNLEEENDEQLRVEQEQQDQSRTSEPKDV